MTRTSLLPGTLACSGISKRFGSTTALRDAGFTARAGEVLGVIGPNGSGKSTLLACAAGVLRADAGTVALDARSLTLREIGETIFLLPDGITPWAEHFVHEVLDFWRRLHDRSADDVRRRIADVALGALMGRRVSELSKGERKRTMLALALLAHQPVLMLDEPLDGLDLRQAREVVALLRTEAKSGRTIVVSLHQLGDAERLCDRLALLDNGRIVAEGSMDALRSSAGRAGATLEEVFLALT